VRQVVGSNIADEALTISSLRIRRCSHRRKTTKLNAPEMTAAKIPNQDTGMVVLEGDDLASRRSIPTGSGQVLRPTKVT